ncbi:MAG: nucleotidyltransferase family protein [Candidatus Micrarchaeia archaeon]
MEALILCGGFAKRLEPITLFVPKPLLPVNGKPLLDHILDKLESLHVDRIVITTNRKFADQFSYFIENKKLRGYKSKIELIVEPTLSNEQKLGAIRSIDNAIKSAGIGHDTLVIAGDNYFSSDLKGVISAFERLGAGIIGVYDLKSLDSAKNFGVVRMDGDVIVKFEEKPEKPSSTLISTGIYVFPSTDLGLFEKYLAEKGNPDAVGYFNEWYIRQKKVYGSKIDGEWYDIGTIDTYKSLYEKFMTKK